MNTQEFDTASTATGPLLVLLSASQAKEFEGDGLERQTNSAPTVDRRVSPSRPSVADAPSSWPKAVIPGSLPALLLIILRRPRGRCPPHPEWRLPAGCVLAVRYRSR